jgi:c-di-GMP-binding flagellar brake protein YcgR
VFKKVYSADMQAERRKSPRIPLNIAVKYQCLPKDRMTMPTDSLSENLGMGGLAMRVDHKLEPNDRISLVLYLPPADKRDDVQNYASYAKQDCLTVRIEARVAWCQPFAGNKFMLGIEFIQIDPEDMPEFRAFVKDYELRGQAEA